MRKNSWFMFTFSIYLLLFYLRFTARQDCFTHFYPSQSLLGGAKMIDPREKPADHSQADLGVSHMRPELGFNPQ